MVKGKNKVSPITGKIISSFKNQII